MNDMRERLVELMRQGDEQCYKKKQCNDCPGYGYDRECINHLIAEHLIANGVIVPPCKIGDSCYPLWHSRNKPIVERKISRITYSARNVIIGYYENDGQYRPPLRTRVLGRDVFLTREEAERALKERE